jgi:hypothetical protein
MTFQIHPLQPKDFAPPFGLPDDALVARGVTPMVADAKPGFPCRIALRDAEPGERVLLLNFEHQPGPGAYRSSHAIFVIDGAIAATPEPDELPEVMRSRLLSVRAFTADAQMTDADVVDGRDAPALFERFLANPSVSYLHVHYARRGCFAARVERG